MNASDIPNMFPLTCALDGLRKTNENALNFKNKIEKCVETTLNSEKFESGIFTNTFTQTNTSQFNSYDPTESIRKAEHVLESAYEQRKDTIKNLNYLNILSTFRNSGKNTKLQGFKKIFNGQICPIDKIVKKKKIEYKPKSKDLKKKKQTKVLKTKPTKTTNAPMSEDLYIENYKKRLKLGARLLKEYDKVKIIDSTTKYKNQFNTKPTISKNVMKSVNLDYFDNFEKIHKQNKKNDKFNTMDGNQSKSKFNRKVNSSSLINDFNNVNNNNNDDYTMNNKNVNKMVITCATQTIPPKKDKKQDKTTRQKFLSNLIKEWVDFNSGKSIKEKKKINVNVDKKKTKTCNKAIDTKCDEMSLKYVENENNLELLNCKNVKELIKSIKDYANPPNINDRYEEIIRNVEGEISKELENLRIEKVANTKLTHVNNKIIEKYVESAVIKKTSLILKEKENLTQKNYNYHVEGKNDSLKQTEISKEIMAQQENVKKMDTSNETSLDEYTEYSSDSFLTDVSDSQTGVIEKDEENFKKIDNMINYSENIKAQSIKIQESSTESYSDTLTGPYSETLQTTESIDSKIRSSISLVNVKIQMNKKKLHSKSENKNCNNCCKRKRYTKSQKIVYIQKTHEEPLNYNLNNIKNFEMKKSMLNHIAKNNSKFPKSIQTDFVEEEKIHEDFIAVENVKPIKIIPIGHQIINLQDEHENFKEPSIETYSSIQSISTCEWLTESVNEGEFSYSSDSTLVPN